MFAEWSVHCPIRMTSPRPISVRQAARWIQSRSAQSGETSSSKHLTLLDVSAFPVATISKSAVTDTCSGFYSLSPLMLGSPITNCALECVLSFCCTYTHLSWWFSIIGVVRDRHISFHTAIPIRMHVQSRHPVPEDSVAVISAYTGHCLCEPIMHASAHQKPRV